MPAEATHELGRTGAVNANHLLWRVLGESIALPFNTYDHAAKLRFDGSACGLGTFNFDLRGHLQKIRSSAVTGFETVEVLVEVKNYSDGNSLLGEYESFLKRAAFTGSLPEHSDTRFIFLCNVPFGTTMGTKLCNGEYLKERSATWDTQLQPLAEAIRHRIVLIIATNSFNSLLQQWGSSKIG